MDKLIGPTIPSGFLTGEDRRQDQEKEEDKISGPDIGTQKIAHFESKGLEEDVLGPALPPNFVKDDSEKVIGPQIPGHLKHLFERNENENSDEEMTSRNDNFNRDEISISEDEEDQSDGEVFGPKLPTEGDKNLDPSSSRRVISTKDERKKIEREEWMTVVPKSMAKKLGMKSVTSFSRKGTGSEPSQAEEKNQFSNESSSERNERMTQLLDEYNKLNKRNVSLLEMHQEKRNKKKKLNESNSKERVPFNPETDLQMRRFNSRQTKSVIEKAQLLDTRFSRGSSKFL